MIWVDANMLRAVQAKSFRAQIRRPRPPSPSKDPFRVTRSVLLQASLIRSMHDILVAVLSTSTFTGQPLNPTLSGTRKTHRG